ncbi:MAG: hypothetical protein WA085_13440 [Sphingobium sp.]
MPEWKRYEQIHTIMAHRPGWRGALDAVVSAITGRPALSVPQQVTISIYSTGSVDMAVFQVKRVD